nr:hypothetical protein [Caballeronia catudaia]
MFLQLDGGSGLNRAVAGCAQIAADNDLDAIRAWLARFVGTKTTFENYRKEAERLVLWSVVVLGKPLSSLTHEDSSHRVVRCLQTLRHDAMSSRVPQ